MNQFWFLIKHEFRLEFRQKYLAASVFLFVLSTVYVVYQAVQKVQDTKIWNSLLWIILLFGAFQAISRSFSREADGLKIYLFHTVKPTKLILSKLVYNVLFMFITALISVMCYGLFLGFDAFSEASFTQYLIAFLSGAAGFGCLLTLVSAMAVQANAGSGLTAILGLPLSIPLILIITRLTTEVLKGGAQVSFLQNLAFLWALNLGLAGLTYLLFPYLWRE